MKIPTNYSIDVTTVPLSNGMIEQQTNIMGEIRRIIYEAQDEEFKQALMQLGWLPPEEVFALRQRIEHLDKELADAYFKIWGLVP